MPHHPIRIAAMFHNFGPYHEARLHALQNLIGSENLISIELAGETGTYAWNAQKSRLAHKITLFPGERAEDIGWFRAFLALRKALKEAGDVVYFSPSYSPASSFSGIVAARLIGLKTVMMNESHAGTARAKGLSALAKRLLVRSFDAAFVGGIPHRDYFVELGIPKERVFTGYDAIDNDYFKSEAANVKREPEPRRRALQLPRRYFLSLGRFVEKKNLKTLLDAYSLLLERNPEIEQHLVFVGSGPLWDDLKAHAHTLNLDVVDHTATGSAEPTAPCVHFYGFRQIEENPTFYALADAFVLPSHTEEWGLVVNEAMACGTPVIVSNRAGCAQDLLPKVDGYDESDPSGPKRCLTGYTFPPDSASSLMFCLNSMATNFEEREKMGAAAATHIEKFSCEEFARQAVQAAERAMSESH